MKGWGRGLTIAGSQGRTSFLTPLPEHQAAADLLSEAADDILASMFSRAARGIAKADFPALAEFATQIIDQVSVDIHQFREVGDAPLRTKNRVKARMPSGTVARTIFERDGWRCRYCDVRIISFDAINTLNRLFPSLIRRNGPAKRMHGGCRALASSLDHILPHSRGGTNEPKNLVASCHPCQFGRNQWTLEEVGFLDPRDRQPIVDEWDGLTRLLTPDAEKLVDDAIASGIPNDIDMNGVEIVDPGGGELTEAEIERKMSDYGFDRATVISLWGP